MATCEVKKKRRIAPKTPPKPKAEIVVKTVLVDRVPPFKKAKFLQCGTVYSHEITFTAKDVVYDKDNWAKAERFRPTPFALMSLRVKRKNLEGKEIEKTIPGWWTGSSWDGKSLETSDEVLYWKNREGKDE